MADASQGIQIEVAGVRQAGEGFQKFYGGLERLQIIRAEALKAEGETLALALARAQLERGHGHKAERGTLKGDEPATPSEDLWTQGVHVEASDRGASSGGYRSAITLMNPKVVGSSKGGRFNLIGLITGGAGSHPITATKDHGVLAIPDRKGRGPNNPVIIRPLTQSGMASVEHPGVRADDFVRTVADRERPGIRERLNKVAGETTIRLMQQSVKVGEV